MCVERWADPQATSHPNVTRRILPPLGHRTARRMSPNSWLLRLGVAAASMAGALVLTHAFWPLLQQTPFLLGFAAAILSSRIGGRHAGALAVIIGVLGYASFPPPLPADGFGRLLLGFVIISGTFSWFVARRYEIEADLRASQDRLRAVVSSLPIVLWMTDRDGVVTLAEGSGLEVFDLKPREVIGRSVFDLYRDVPEIITNMRRVLAGETFTAIVSLGDVVVETWYSPLRDHQGSASGAIGVSIDVTERRAAEQVVIRSERRLQTIIDAEPACVKLVAPDGLLLDVNRAGLEMIGVDHLAQVVGRPVINLVHPEDRGRYLAMHEAATGGSPGRLEFRIVGLGGEERWVDSHAVPFDISTDQGEKRPAVLSVTSDITERVRAQHALHDAEERMRFALEASRLGIWDTNLQTGVSYWSETCEVLHGLERGTFGKTFAAFIDRVHPEDRETVLQTIDNAVRERRDADIEYRTLWPDGIEHRISSTAHFFYDEAGVPLRGAGVSIDVTERRSLEEQLRQSHKMEAIGLLAGGIAHDFNNLLTAIGGYTEMVFHTLDGNDARREDLNEVAKATKRAAALTRQLLAVSRRQILQPTVVDVNAMVAEVQKLLRRTIPENISLQLELSPVLDPVRADRGQLEQVVLNLAINAGDAMPQGGHLRLATDTVDVDEAWAKHHRPMPGGRYVRLTVSDTGSGMTLETQSHIFEPFFTTKERGKGTGLGLATVYGIVKQSEGFIWVESEVGRGTTFEIYLPIVHEPVEPPVHVAAPVDVAGGSQTILLAEDDGAVRRLARDVLASQGYTVLDARDGDDALAIARRYPNAIHLLIADVVMPGLSGRDLAARLTVERPDVRVLYTSGYTENVMTRSGFEHGLTLLAKPFLPNDLLRKVRETFERSD
jgi:two-component system cell cycle sensor histidine kinase/response regulator CckA